MGLKVSLLRNGGAKHLDHSEFSRFYLFLPMVNIGRPSFSKLFSLAINTFLYL